MNLIVNTRYNERRPTIFTTNYEDLPDDTELDSLKVRVGFRLHSRLHEMCEFLEYDGGDYRMLPANGGAGRSGDALEAAHRGRRALPARDARARPAPRSREIREPNAGSARAEVARRQGRAASRSDDARPLPPHPVLPGDLQLLQFQSRPVRRRAEDALRRRARARDSSTAGDGRAADTIFFGGGTPSLLEPAEVARLIAACRDAVRPRARRRDHARDQSRDRHARAAGRRFARPASIASASACSRSTTPSSRGSAGFTRPRAPREAVRAARARRLHEPQLRPDVLAARPVAGVLAADGRRGDRARARSPVALSARALSERAAEGGDGARATARAGGRRRPTTRRPTCIWRRSSASTRPASRSTRSRTSRVPAFASRHNVKYWQAGSWRGFGCGAHSTVDGVRWKNVASTDGLRRPHRRGASRSSLDRQELSRRRAHRGGAVHGTAADGRHRPAELSGAIRCRSVVPLPGDRSRRSSTKG